jgi:spore maturation protein CgeB
MGACIVSNPYLGIETWFEPEKEIVVVKERDEAVESYRWLLAHDSERRKIGTAARERVLREHTFRHRAQQLAEIVKGYV